jgi:hypothetical protein
VGARIVQAVYQQAVGWTARVQFPAGARDFLYFTASRPALGFTQPPIQWVLGTVSPGVKQPGCETDNSPPSSVEVKNGGAIPALPHTSSWHKDNSTFYLHILVLEIFPNTLNWQCRMKLF